MDKYQQGQPLSDEQKQELAGLLNQYGLELQTMYGYSPQKAAEAIKVLVSGGAFMASTNNVQAYNEAVRYLQGYSIQSGQAAIGTDALLALPGGPGAIARGALAVGGAYQTGTGIGQVIDGKYGEGALNLGLGTAAIFGGVAGNSVISKGETGIVSPNKGTGWAENSQPLDPRTPSANPKVTAELTDPQTRTVFADTNQGGRPDFFLGDASRPTLINGRIVAKIESEGRTFPNGNMATAHAEIGVIQQAFEQGITKGRDMTLTVSLEPVCGFCKGDIAAMEDKAGLKSLTIVEEKTNTILYWQPGMKSIKEKK